MLRGYIERLQQRDTAGENVDKETNALWRAMTRAKGDDDNDRREIVWAIACAAHDPFWTVGGHVWPDNTDEGLCRRVRFTLGVLALELDDHAEDVARAVRLWRRGRGRPSKRSPAGSKWEAVATVLRDAGRGNGSINGAKNVEQLWKEHGVEL
ncbi:MAG TPA: hypothetical protein VGF94_13345 [Kofleriaceae bacterium]|jgi:hypothetical protein